MKCPYLTGRKVQICRENHGMYVPSIFELEEYCQTAKSVRCPFLHRGVDKGYGTTQDRINAPFLGMVVEDTEIFAAGCGKKTDC
jgi:hypothetical protein